MLRIEGHVDPKFETDEEAQKKGKYKSFNKWVLFNDSNIKGTFIKVRIEMQEI